jgi:integrase
MPNELLISQQARDLGNQLIKEMNINKGYGMANFLGVNFCYDNHQALEILKDVMQWSLGEKYIFASPRKHNQPIHFNTLNMAIRKMGYDKHQLSSHGLRSTFSTILNDSGLFQDNWIESQLSHIDKNRTRASYNHAEYLAQRTEMMQWWGNYLSATK